MASAIHNENRLWDYLEKDRAYVYSIFIEFCRSFDMNIQPGMALAAQRFGHTHHGIYAGMVHDTPTVIHYKKFNGGKGRIERTSFREFQKGARCWLDNHGTRYTDAVLEQSLTAAKSRLGEQEYNLFTNNCEHFASECVTGKSHSRQVAGFVAGAAAGLVVGLGVAWAVGAVIKKGRQKRYDSYF